MAFSSMLSSINTTEAQQQQQQKYWAGYDPSKFDPWGRNVGAVDEIKKIALGQTPEYSGPGAVSVNTADYYTPQYGDKLAGRAALGGNMNISPDLMARLSAPPDPRWTALHPANDNGGLMAWADPIMMSPAGPLLGLGAGMALAGGAAAGAGEAGAAGAGTSAAAGGTGAGASGVEAINAAAPGSVTMGLSDADIAGSAFDAGAGASAGAGGVNAVNNAAPGSVSKGLTDSQVAGSVFDPTASGAAGTSFDAQSPGAVFTAGGDSNFGTMVTTAGAGNIGTTASPALIDPASGPVGGSGVSATAGDPFSAGYDLSDSLGGTGDSLAASVAGGGGTAAGSTLGGITDFLGANKSLVIPGAILGAELLNKPKVPQVPNLENLAQNLQHGPAEKATQDAATSLIPSVSTGILPPGADSMVNNAVHDAQGTIRAKYAQLGMSGSTSETQELAAAEARGEAMRFSFAQQLTQTGLQAAGIAAGSDAQAAQIYALIMNAQLQQDAALQNALSNFASSASLGLGLSDIASRL